MHLWRNQVVNDVSFIEQLSCCGASGTDDYQRSVWLNSTRKHSSVDPMVTVPPSCCAIDNPFPVEKIFTSDTSMWNVTDCQREAFQSLKMRDREKSFRDVVERSSATSQLNTQVNTQHKDRWILRWTLRWACIQVNTQANMQGQVNTQVKTESQTFQVLWELLQKIDTQNVWGDFKETTKRKPQLRQISYWPPLGGRRKERRLDACVCICVCLWVCLSTVLHSSFFCRFLWE